MLNDDPSNINEIDPNVGLFERAIDGTSQHYTSSSKTRFNSSCMPLLNE